MLSPPDAQPSTLPPTVPRHEPDKLPAPPGCSVGQILCRTHRLQDFSGMAAQHGVRSDITRTSPRRQNDDFDLPSRTLRVTMSGWLCRKVAFGRWVVCGAS